MYFISHGCKGDTSFKTENKLKCCLFLYFTVYNAAEYFAKTKFDTHEFSLYLHVALHIWKGCIYLDTIIY